MAVEPDYLQTLKAIASKESLESINSIDDVSDYERDYRLFFDSELEREIHKLKRTKELEKNYSRICYEKLIPNLNKWLCTLRRDCTPKTKVGRKPSKLYTENNHGDERLECTLKDRVQQIDKLEKLMQKLQKQCKNYKSMSGRQVQRLQRLYGVVRNQLKNEIKLETRALGSLDKFRMLRDAAVNRLQNSLDFLGGIEREYQSSFFKLSQDDGIPAQTSSASDKIGSWRSLARGNTSSFEKSHGREICVMDENDKKFFKSEAVINSYAPMENFAQHLHQNIKNKNEIIKRLTNSLVRIKNNFDDSQRYRNICYKTMKNKYFEPKTPRNVQEMNAVIQQLKADKVVLLKMGLSQECQIQRLREVLDELMSTAIFSMNALNLKKNVGRKRKNQLVL